MTTKYVVGFLFNHNHQRVVLIQKNRPAWQLGRLNGIGGHVEADELSSDAMIREFKEETSLDITEWRKFTQLNDTNRNFLIDFFWSKLSIDDCREIHTVTDEVVGWYSVEAIINRHYYTPLANLYWLIPMAINDFLQIDRCNLFRITEMSQRAV